MCFSSGGGSSSPTPAPVQPPAPSLPAEQSSIASTSVDRTAKTATSGTGSSTTRVDRSADSSLMGGSGLNM